MCCCGLLSRTIMSRFRRLIHRLRKASLNAGITETFSERNQSDVHSDEIIMLEKPSSYSDDETPSIKFNRTPQTSSIFSRIPNNPLFASTCNYPMESHAPWGSRRLTITSSKRVTIATRVQLANLQRGTSQYEDAKNTHKGLKSHSPGQSLRPSYDVTDAKQQRRASAFPSLNARHNTSYQSFDGETGLDQGRRELPGNGGHSPIMTSAPRRESFLYRSESDFDFCGRNASRNNSLASESHTEDVIVTPFAQILASLRQIKDNYIELSNLTGYLGKRESENILSANFYSPLSPTLSPTDTNPTASKTSSSNQEEMDSREKMNIETLIALEWCLNQLETIQTHRSVADMASNKFRLLLNKELNSHFSNSKSGNQISNYICSTFLDKQQEMDIHQSDEIFDEADSVNSTNERPPPPDIKINQQDTDEIKQIQVGEVDGVRSSDSLNIPCSDFNKIVDSSCDPALNEALKNIDKWGIDIFRINDLSNGRPLTVITYKILEQRNLIGFFKIPEETLIKFLYTLESHYRPDVPYHNNIHAADVTQTTHFLMSAQTLENVFSELEILAAIFACAIHDVDHPGYTNQFLINCQDKLALLYNDESVLENHHLALSFTILQDKNCNIFKNLSKKQTSQVRKMVIDMVLATDMSKHMQLLATLKTMVERKRISGSEMMVLEVYSDRIQVLQNMVHCADISNATKPLDIYRKWVNRLLTEFFNQGDRERELGMDISPMCDKQDVVVAKSQVGFIDFVIHPLWETWADLVHPEAQKIIDTLKDNRDWFEGQIALSPSIQEEDEWADDGLSSADHPESST